MREVFTLQNRHPRVHVSPINIIVAVAAALEPPPQHSEIFGHLASSQTVCRFNPRRSFLIFLYDDESGMDVFNHDGRRVISFFLPGGPTRAVLRAYASSGERGGSAAPPTKSENDGPLFSLSLNVVGVLLVVGFDSPMDDSGVVVAYVRVLVMDLRT